ncbi:TPA: hypothetical protein DIV55_00760 [Patescibacteria group bacterium]|uniref:Uncharacterized protein n=1 Tax=Candidatus Gottesmanbacteria bacterium GW2011_GWA1_43_11 TaxID=1618436 RepID=A0A0G1EQZ1_9BACT|nr:MAG: hypothetical protein UV59_C0007G0049 [Candidatus Gottesmanbacteria bacterium GW2011_GWA1_43_11]HCS78255.1 hypothetical protein [Patescibacteria group bacterium]
MERVKPTYASSLPISESIPGKEKLRRKATFYYLRSGYNWISDVSHLLEIPTHETQGKQLIKIPVGDNLRVEAAEYDLPNNLQLSISRNFGNSLDPYFHVCLAENNPESYTHPETYIRFATNEAVKIKVDSRKRQFRVTQKDGIRIAINVLNGEVIKLHSRMDLKTTHTISESSLFHQLVAVVRFFRG